MLSATGESLWYFELVTYLRPHFCANDVYIDEDMTPMHMTMFGAWYGGVGGQ